MPPKLPPITDSQWTHIMELLARADYYGARGTERAWQWLASEGSTLSLKTFQNRLRIEKEHRRKRAEEATQRTEEATPTMPALPLVDAGRAVPLGASLVDAAVPVSETTIGLRQAPSPPPQPAAPARCPGPQPRPAQRAHPQPQ